MTEWLHFHFSLSRIGEGNGNPLQCSCLENPREGGVWWAAVYGVTQSRTRLKWLSSSSSSSPLVEKAMAPHSSTLAWKIPWMAEPGRLQSMGLLRVGHDWATSLSLFTFMHWRRKWRPTPVFLPGESQGLGSLVGCRLRGRAESDTTEAPWQQQQQQSLRLSSFVFPQFWEILKQLFLESCLFLIFIVSSGTLVRYFLTWSFWILSSTLNGFLSYFFYFFDALCCNLAKLLRSVLYFNKLFFNYV